MIKDPEAEKWLAKNKKKNQYWQVKSYLNNLRIPYKVLGKDVDTLIEAPLFGLRFRFNGVPDIDDFGWDIFQLDQNKMDKNPYYFGEDLMWNLIEKGYFAYIRDAGGGESRIFSNLIIDGGWGTKILEKRIELCGNAKKHTFLRMRTTELLKLALPRIISLYPGTFDYLT